MTLEGRLVIQGVSKSVSQLALGTAFYSLEQSEAHFRLMDRFLECNGTMIDSGRIYGDSEAVIGRWMKSRSTRDDVLLITKGGHGSDNLLPARNLSTVIAAELDISLEMLGTDYVDLYMLHRDNPIIPVSDVMDCLNTEIERGGIKSFGLSNWSYSRASEANEYAVEKGMCPIAMVSNNLSLAVPRKPFYLGLVTTNAEGERWHTDTSIPLLSWSSQARGFFTGRYVHLPENRPVDPFIAKMIETYRSDENIERLARARTLADEKRECTSVRTTSPN